MAQGALRVGELAKRTGLTVRTLHHYDEIGLLSPSGRTDAGYRLYGPVDVARLQQIASLRQLGFSLGEIRDCLQRPDISPRRIIAMHIARLGEQIELRRALCRQLEAIDAHLASAEEVSTDLFLRTMEVMSKMEEIYDKYYTPEQRAEIAERARVVGQERIRQVEGEWPRLIAEAQAEMERGTDPSDERVLALARRWQGLVAEFTGGNPGIAQSLNRMYQNEPAVRERSGISPELGAYMGKALAAIRED